jgi:glyoxylase-like metal-dependent hydrolase (beta-lactamase superfamily II)
VSGDFLFKDASGNPLAHTQVAGLQAQEVANFFGLQDWPNNPTTLDLGGRQLDVLPIPGHEQAHIAVYDHQTQILLSGDTLYPGHLFVADWTTYRQSIARLDAWIHESDATGTAVRPITYVLGNHIEKAPAPGQFYPYPSFIQDPERKLELQDSDVTKLSQEAQSLGPVSPDHEILLDEFSIDPI